MAMIAWCRRTGVEVGRRVIVVRHRAEMPKKRLVSGIRPC
jgi:hypothetical protein